MNSSRAGAPRMRGIPLMRARSAKGSLAYSNRWAGPRNRAMAGIWATPVRTLNPRTIQ